MAAQASSSMAPTPMAVSGLGELPDLTSLLGAGMMVRPGAPVAAAFAGQKLGASSASVVSATSTATVAAQPDGRACATCQVKDSDPDRVVTSMTMKWGYPPDPSTHRNVGRICFYCNRVWQARYKQKYRNLDSFVQALGNDLSLVQVFGHWRDMAVTLMQEKGRHDIKVTWGEEASVRQVVKRLSGEVRLEDPTDIILAPEVQPTNKSTYTNTNKTTHFLRTTGGNTATPCPTDSGTAILRWAMLKVT